MTIRRAYAAQTIPGALGWSRVEKTFGMAVPIFTSDLVTNNAVALMIVPPDFVVTRLSGTIPKLDNGTGLLLSLGDAAVPGRLFTASTIGQAGGSVPNLNPAALAYKFPAHNEILLTVAAGATTPVAGTTLIYIEGFLGP